MQYLKEENLTKALTKTYHITYDKSFMAELRRIPRYYIKKLKNSQSPNTIIESVMGRIKILEEFPFIGKQIIKNKKFEYRKFIIKNYIIIYKINLKEKEINILHIYNQKQKIKNKKQYIKI